MPIAFDPPAHAPHGTLPGRATRAADDAGALDIFTQMLMAAAGAQDASAADAPAAPRKDPRTADQTDADPTLLLLSLPGIPIPAAPGAPSGVTIVASEKRIAPPGNAAAAPIAAVVQPPVADAAALLSASKEDAAPVDASPARSRSATHADANALLPDASGAAGAPTSTPDHAPAQQAGTALLAALGAAAEPDRASSAKAEADRRLAADVTPLAAPAQGASQAPVHIETVAAPAFTPGWQDETVARLAHIVVTRNERAELKLNPAELGPVSIRVDMHADQASLTIVAASPDTRSALEQSLPQLRDLLASQGITLGQASVHDGAAQRDAQRAPWTAAGSAGRDAGAAAPVDSVQRVTLRRIDRLVDIFA